MQCVILAGGFGRRLGELTQNCPKPLLPVNGKAFLSYIIENLVRFGFDNIIILAGYKREVFNNYSPLKSIKNSEKVSLTILEETFPLGTGGAIRNALPMLDEKFLLINGDTFFDFNWLDLCYEPLDDKFEIRIAVCKLHDASRFGHVFFSNKGELFFNVCSDFKFIDKYVNGGIYWMSRRTVEKFPDIFPLSLENDIFPILGNSGKISGKVYNSFFIDIGVKEDYNKSQSAFPIKHDVVFTNIDLYISTNYSESLFNKIQFANKAIEKIKLFNDLNIFVYFIINDTNSKLKQSSSKEKFLNLKFEINRKLLCFGAHIDGLLCYTS